MSDAAATGPFNVLFTCAGRRVALLEAFRGAMASLGLSGRILVTDITPTAPTMHRADEGLLVPPIGSDEYLPRLREIVGAYDVRLLVPLTDRDLMLLAEQRDALAQLGCTAMVAPSETMAVCRDKRRFHEMLARTGLPQMRTWTLEAFLSRPVFPCFVKPVNGSAGIGAGRIDDQEALRAHVATYGADLIVQEYVAGQEFTMDVFRRRDGVVCAVVPRQRLSIRGGEVEKGITVRDDALVEQTLRMISHLPGAWGVMNAQCRRRPDGTALFFEANLRFGGGAPLTIAAGVDLPGMVIREVLGMPVEPRIGRFTDNLLMMRYDEAVFQRVEQPEHLPGYAQPTGR